MGKKNCVLVKRSERRAFLRAASAIAVPLCLPSVVLGDGTRSAPSERITVGIIGLGSRGFNLIAELLKQPDVQIVAICDVDSLHYRDRDWGQGRAYGRKPGEQTVRAGYADRRSGTPARGLTVTSDFREVCERDDIDAIVVATPDHWHALCTLTALRSGKDVYCEKPVTHTFHEGEMVSNEVARRGAVFQTGSQQRSESPFPQAVELVRNGHLGIMERIEVGLPPGYAEPQGDPSIESPPDHLDYDMWTGPAPKLPYMRARHHRWWRGHRAYGGGVLMDWIGHHNDIAHWSLGLDKSGPERVEAISWKFPETDVYDTPEHYEIVCEYPGGIQTSIADRHKLGTRWIGEDGWLYIRRGRIEASDPRWLKPDFDRGPEKVYRSPGHMRNFLECIKSRRECIAPAETAHRSITPGHLGYVSHALGRPLRWNADLQQVEGDPEAERLLHASSYRKPWELSG